MLTLNRIAFNLWGVDVYWYGIIISVAIIACVLFAMLFCKLKKIDTNMPLEIFLAIIPLGILSARLFSVIFEPGLTLADYFNFRTGGMSIMGAIIGGAVGATIYKLIKKKPFLEIADVITSVLLLGQAIGRWGNYFNEEVYGLEITNPANQWFPLGVNVDGTWYEALFFYESVLTFVGFVVFLIIYLKTNKRGLVTGLYLTYYGVVRIILESRRQSQYILKWGSVPVSSLVSAAFIAAGVGILIFVIVKTLMQRREKKVG
ncbi:MAG: prolipoprotein diacylglyceryl transferase [Clostridia bacterium]|nr:prolipoprotein diacylglyceryl transferase [Clostridia bacterium]